MTTTTAYRAGSMRWFWACLVHEGYQRWGGGRLKDSRARTNGLVERMAQIEAEATCACIRAWVVADRFEHVVRAVGLERAALETSPVTPELRR